MKIENVIKMRDAKNLASIQFFRGIAVLLVLIFHANGVMMSPNYFGEEVSFVSKYNYGYIGVDLFFVISGFIIFYVHKIDFGKKNIKLYFIKRFIRIFPLYWVSCFILGVAYMLKGDFLTEANLSPSEILTDIFLLPSSRDRNFLEVAWTLFYELTFYAVFSILIFNKKFGVVAISCYFMLAFASVVMLTKFHMPINLVLGYQPLEFALGILVAIFIDKIQGCKKGLVLIAVGISFLVSGVFVNGTYPQEFRSPFNLVFALSAACLICGTLVIEKSRILIKKTNIIYFIGSASYSIYLTHTPLLWVIGRIATKLDAIIHLPVDIWFVLIASTTLCGGCIFYLFIEKPMLAFLRKLLLPNPQREIATEKLAQNLA